MLPRMTPTRLAIWAPRHSGREGLLTGVQRQMKYRVQSGQQVAGIKRYRVKETAAA